MKRPGEIRRKYCPWVSRAWAFVLVGLLPCIPVGFGQTRTGDDGHSHRRRLIQYEEDAIDDHYIVFLRDEVVADEKLDRLKQTRSVDVSFHIRYTYSTMLNGFAVSNISESALDELLLDDDVDFIEQDRPVYLAETMKPNSARRRRTLVESSIQYVNDDLWGLDRIDSPQSLDGKYHYTYTGAGVYAYIFDTGIRFDHPEFSDRAACGLNLMSDDEDCDDHHGHGTHVAGVIGGTTYGVAKDVQLRAVKTLDRKGNGKASSVIAGLEYVHQQRELDNGKTVIVNLSLGSAVSIALNTAVENAEKGNLLVVMAGGNGGYDACITSPSSANTGIAVGAVNQASKKTPASNYGPCIDIFAPGSRILSSSIKREQSEHKTGTSQAAPFLSGVAALYLEHDPTMTPATLTRFLLENHAVANTLSEVGEGSPNLLLQSSGASDLGTDRRPAEFTPADDPPADDPPADDSDDSPGFADLFSCGLFFFSACSSRDDCCIPFCRSLGIFGVRCWLW